MRKIIFFILLLNLMFICDIVFCDYDDDDPLYIHRATTTYKAADIPKNKIIVYPNPWIPESGVSMNEDESRKNTLKHGHLSAEGWIKFAGVTKNTGTLRIYDVTGNLVRNFRWNVDNEKNNFPVDRYEFSKVVTISTSPVTRRIEYYETQEWADQFVNKYNIIHWDGKDNNYEYVKSGVYVWILSEDGGYTHHGKIVVVR